MKRILLAVVALGMTAFSYGQISHGGQPFSYNGKALDNDNQIHSVALPTLDLATIEAEDELRTKNGELERFAYAVDVDYTLGNSGTWTTLPNGDRIWKLRIESEGALALNITYNDFYLPEGARMFIYNEDHTEFIGSFTSENNKPWGGFATGIVRGEACVIEYYEPMAVNGEGTINIDRVDHAYRHITPIESVVRGSDPCEVDVICSPEGDLWQDQAEGACRILVQSGAGSGWCSGALVNNTSFDCKPYVLTAFHCGTSSSTANFNNYVFYFNYQRTSCGSGGASTTSTTGCTKRADSGDGGGNNGSDFLLVELNAAGISTTLQGWNCYWNGWDANNTASPSGVSIHHPSGDVKKISTYTSNLISATWGGTPGTHWRVTWSATTNGHGVTEGGSSGSPIFNNAGRIVGQLTGGSSYCTATSSPDLYGKMSYNWNSNPGDDLDDWLDPGVTGTMSIDGAYYPCTAVADDAGITSINVPTGTICTTTFTPEVVLRNYGSSTLSSVTINYDIDGGATQTYSWTGSLATGATTVVTLSSMTTTTGAHTFNAWTSNPNGTVDGNTSNDDDSGPFTVVSGGTTVDLELITDCWGSETTWSVEDYLGTVLYSGGPYTDVAGGETINESWCIADGCYDFIINDSYGDGMYGSQWGTCTVDGDYTITQGASTLATLIAANADFGNQEINNFVVGTAAVPVPGFTFTPDPACEGAAVSFTNTTTGTVTDYDWDFGDGGSSASTNPSHTYFTANSYTVTLTAENNGCSASTSQTVTITTCVGINDEWLLNAISVYPNPAEDIFNIEVLAELDEDLIVEITNGIGQVIDTFVLNGDNIVTVNMTNQAEGIYYVNIKSSQSMITRKVSLVR